MPGCTINEKASPQFQKLCTQWRRQYPGIDADLQKAFIAISKDILANNAWRIQTNASGVEVYKYRQNSSDIKRGQSYGWRIVALFDRRTGVLYPIIVFPKTAWADADNQTVKQGIREVLTFLGHCISDGCDGMMTRVQPLETTMTCGEKEVKTRCNKCGVTHWKSIVAAADAGIP